MKQIVKLAKLVKQDGIRLCILYTYKRVYACEVVGLLPCFRDNSFLRCF